MGAPDEVVLVDELEHGQFKNSKAAKWALALTKQGSIRNSRQGVYSGKGKRSCRVCANKRGIIRKYGIDECRRCFRENAQAQGWRKFR